MSFPGYLAKDWRLLVTSYGCIICCHRDSLRVASCRCRVARNFICRLPMFDLLITDEVDQLADR